MKYLFFLLLLVSLEACSQPPCAVFAREHLIDSLGVVHAAEIDSLEVVYAKSLEAVRNTATRTVKTPMSVAPPSGEKHIYKEVEYDVRIGPKGGRYILISTVAEDGKVIMKKKYI